MMRLRWIKSFPDIPNLTPVLVGKKKNHRISQNVFCGTLLCGIVSVLHVKGIPSVVEFGHVLTAQYLNPIPVCFGEGPHFMSPCWSRALSTREAEQQASAVPHPPSSDLGVWPQCCLSGLLSPDWHGASDAERQLFRRNRGSTGHPGMVMAKGGST